MICNVCRAGNHDPCIKENVKRDYESCDCQHRVNNKKPKPAKEATDVKQ